MVAAYKYQLRVLAAVAFVLALISTAVGGWVDITREPVVVSKQHAWNDGIFLMLAAGVLLLFSMF